MLFEKPMSELKEAFVRNRFAEEKYFGNPNIERWLEKQRRAKLPEEGQWHYCTSSDRVLFFANKDPIGLLRTYAEPLARVPCSTTGLPEYTDQVAHRAKLRPLLEAFDPKHVEVYYPYVHSPIVIWLGECEAAPEAFYFETAQDANRKAMAWVKYSVPSPMVMDAIFATWRRGSSKAKAARKFLCDVVAQDIALVRAQAEAEFDEAVAVTADGKKILPADMVVVVPGRTGEVRGPVYLYRDASVFRENKIFRHDSKPDTNCLVPQIFTDNEIANEALRFWKKHFSVIDGVKFGPTWLRYVWGYPTKADETGRRDTQQRLIIAPRHLCPDPLPEGGEEILGLI